MSIPEIVAVRVADRSGSVNMSLWDDLGKIIQSGDIVKMTKGYCNVWKSCLTLNCSKISEFVKVGEFCYLFSEQPFLRFACFDDYTSKISQKKLFLDGNNT